MINRTIEFELDDKKYIAEVELDVYTENYGEDADSNRGQLRTNVEVSKVEVVDGTGFIVKQTPEMEEVIDNLINKLDLTEYPDDDRENR